MAENNYLGNLIAILVFWFAQFITYIMAISRWFATDHNTFWYGFKELVWALVPVVNFTYVWDMWLTAVVWAFLLAKAALDLIRG